MSEYFGLRCATCSVDSRMIDVPSIKERTVKKTTEELEAELRQADRSVEILRAEIADQRAVIAGLKRSNDTHQGMRASLHRSLIQERIDLLCGYRAPDDSKAMGEKFTLEDPV
jgi:hypothetical protein